MSLPTRALGRNGPQVTAIGFGAMSIGGVYGSKDTDDQRLSFLDQAYEAGERFWDTADIYFDSEDIIGKWFQQNPEKRKDVFLATKFALDYSTGNEVARSDVEYMNQAIEKSLKRLGVDVIDLYYCHRVDPKVPIEETMRGMVELKKQGKIRYLGLSEVSAATLRRAHAIHPISALQVEYSPFVLDIEDPQIDLLNTCRELGIAVVAYSPLGRGFLTGQFKSLSDLPDAYRGIIPRFTGENFPKVLEVVKKLEAIGARRGSTSGQVTLAWLMAQDELVIPIPGTRTVKYLKENVEAARVTLSEEEVKEIRDILKAAKLSGGRAPDAFSSYFFADTVLP